MATSVSPGLRRIQETVVGMYSERPLNRNTDEEMGWRLKCLGIHPNGYQGRRVLDMGCGTGEYALWYAMNRGQTVTAIDLADGSLAIARQGQRETGVQNLASQDGSFDQTRARARRGDSARRQWLARALEALACASGQHIVGVQEPAYGKCRMKALEEAGRAMSAMDAVRELSDPVTWSQAAWGNEESNLEFLEQTGLLNGRPKILEIGSGKGSLLSSLLGRGLDVCGCDIDFDALVAGGLVLPVVVAAGDRLPFADSSFDVVLSFDVFEHIPDSDRHLAEVRRVLRPGGHYALQTPNILTNVPFAILRTSIRFGVKNVMWAFRPPQHCALHSYWGLRRRLQRNGFAAHFYRIPVVNAFFRAKMRRYTGAAGVAALRVVNPDRLPMPLRTNLFVAARKLR